MRDGHIAVNILTALPCYGYSLASKHKTDNINNQARESPLIAREMRK
ncbi:hypothetical protein CAter282_4217 [Collimonas arenae]|uniref:Uncharacterized protein n=1 Tax=Collimonas arenae TaxID=279058 RepID=A0A127QPI5_9BURK|nr:hypothetical protein [Collimonas arenae]AMP01981.1 hypothetical protein CAter10_4591 [Collimonas arenae]AMP11877.1 hypothetical protein CAter282_4217 [Collimonas arenae]